MKRLIGAGLAVGLAAAGLGVAASPADATVRVGAINCSATTVLGSTALLNPSTSHIDGPYWSTTGAAETFVNKGGVQILPTLAAGVPIVGFSNLVTRARIVGTATTDFAPLGAGPTPPGAGFPPAGGVVIYDGVTIGVPGTGIFGDGMFYYDTDVTDAVPPVPMDGLGGNPAPPVVKVYGPPAFIGTPGTYEVLTAFGGSGIVAPAPPGLPVAGPVGGAVYSPDLAFPIADVGATDGAINWLGTSTSLTARVTPFGPPGIDATTACVPGADSAHTIHVHTVGGPILTSDPVVACDPTNGTTGLNSASKGLSTPGGVKPLPANSAAATKEVMTFDGCIVPDVQSDAWVAAKQGPTAALAPNIVKASISIKGKNYGNCTLVDIRNAAGQNPNADSAMAYETYSVATIKWLDAANKPVKGASTTSATLYSRLIINLNSYTPMVTSEHNGVVTKGFGAGGVIEIVSELDLADPDVAGLVACNTGGAPPAGVYLQKTGLPLLTGDDAVLEIKIP